MKRIHTTCRRTWFTMILLAVVAMTNGIQSARGQAPDCAPVIARLEQVTRECSDLNRNYACYGSAVARADPTEERFDIPGDRVPMLAAQQIGTLDELGTVVMNVSIGDANPVKIISFGQIQVDPSGDKLAPHVFSVDAETADPICERTPPGLVVYTTTDQVGMVNINGVDLELGSAAYVTLPTADTMVIASLEGHVRVAINGQAYPLPVDFEVQIQNLATVPEFAGPPRASDLVNSAVVQWLVDSPLGMRKIYTLNETPLSCLLHNAPMPSTHDLTSYTPGQECLITFCAQQGDTVTVRMDALDLQLNPWIDLRGPDQRLVNRNNDIAEGNISALICNQHLPVDGCYTVVARSLNNDSAGRFRLQLLGESDCEEPEALCTVKPRQGLNLRQSETYADPSNITAALPQGTQMKVIGKSPDRPWLYVQAVGNPELKGWIWQNDEAEICGGVEPAVITVTPTSTVSVTPLPTPTGTRPPHSPTNTPTSPPPTPVPPTSTPLPPDPGPTKQSPFGEP